MHGLRLTASLRMLLSASRKRCMLRRTRRLADGKAFARFEWGGKRRRDVITLFYLVPEDGGGLASFEPGQYVSIKVDQEGAEHTQIRQYSLSDAPGKPYYRISVKREDADASGSAGQVSTYLHKHVSEGETLWLSAPAGDFTL